VVFPICENIKTEEFKDIGERIPMILNPCRNPDVKSGISAFAKVLE
jgi:hypothetical protein